MVFYSKFNPRRCLEESVRQLSRCFDSTNRCFDLSLRSTLYRPFWHIMEFYMGSIQILVPVSVEICMWVLSLFLLIVLVSGQNGNRAVPNNDTTTTVSYTHCHIFFNCMFSICTSLTMTSGIILAAKV